MTKTLRVIAVNKPHGTMTVMWDNDPELEWNYYIPLDSDDVPLQGDALLRHLVSTSYEQIEIVLVEREKSRKRGLANFDAHNSLRRQRFNVEEMVGEYEELHRIT